MTNPIVKNIFVSWKTTLLGVLAFVVMNSTQILNWLDGLRGVLVQPGPTDWKSIVIGTLTMLGFMLARDGDKSSEATGANPPMNTLPKVAPLLALVFIPGLLMLSGCGTDPRVTSAIDGAQRREDNCIQNHMQIHAVEQQSLAAAQYSDIKFRTTLNVQHATDVATANKAVTPAQLAADIARSYDEAQRLRDGVQANISSLQMQIAAINADHVAAQTIMRAVQDYNKTPSVTATGVATVTVDALSQSRLIKPAKPATIVPAPDSGTVAEPVPPVSQ